VIFAEKQQTPETASEAKARKDFEDREFMMKIRAQISGNHESAGSVGTVSSSSEQQPELSDDALYAQNKLTQQNKGARWFFYLMRIIC
jgi:hypothetical protein